MTSICLQSNNSFLSWTHFTCSSTLWTSSCWCSKWCFASLLFWTRSNRDSSSTSFCFGGMIKIGCVSQNKQAIPSPSLSLLVQYDFRRKTIFTIYIVLLVVQIYSCPSSDCIASLSCCNDTCFFSQSCGKQLGVTMVKPIWLNLEMVCEVDG